MIKGIGPDEARDLLYDLPAAPETETVAVLSSLGRVIATDVIAAIPIPPFDRSPYDGYAFIGADTAAATREEPVTLKITEELPAGTAPTIDVTRGYCAKILTGAPIPPGADCTVKYETTEFTDAEVKVFTPVAPGTDIVYAGEDVKLGAPVARRGDLITPPMMGLLSSIGLAETAVYKPPRAALIITGAELVEPGDPLPFGKIYNSNASTLSGYLRGQGVDLFNAGVVDDIPELIAERIKASLEGSDIVITTGGASVGDYDCAIRAAEILGAEILFWKAQIKPGGAAVAAVLDGKLILSLSGNPGGAVMFLLRCAMPYIRKLCGRTDCYPESIEVFLKYPFNKLSERSRLLRGQLEITGGKAYFAEHGAQGGGDISSFVVADLLAEIAADSAPLPAGTLVKAWRL